MSPCVERMNYMKIFILDCLIYGEVTTRMRWIKLRCNVSCVVIGGKEKIYVNMRFARVVETNNFQQPMIDDNILNQAVCAPRDAHRFCRQVYKKKVLVIVCLTFWRIPGRVSKVSFLTSLSYNRCGHDDVRRFSCCRGVPLIYTIQLLTFTYLKHIKNMYVYIYIKCLGVQ